MGTEVDKKPEKHVESKETKHDHASEKASQESSKPKDVRDAHKAEQKRVQSSVLDLPPVHLVDKSAHKSQEQAKGSHSRPGDEKQPGKTESQSTDKTSTDHKKPEAKEVKLKDGETKTADGAKITRTDGHITKVTDAKGTSREFAYDEKGKINQVKDETGAWKTIDGLHWKNEKGEGWTGQVRVRDDGAYMYQDAKGVTVKHTDGTTAVQTRDGGARLEDTSGKVKETVNARGQHTKFNYDSKGNLNAVEENGTKWTTTDGKHWSSGDGKTWEGTKAVDKDGTYRSVDAANTQTTKRLDGTIQVKEFNGHETIEGKDGKVTELHKAVDRGEMLKVAEEIRKATGNDNYVARWADKEKVNDLLKDKTEAERRAINEAYKANYGKSLDEEIGAFESGSDLEKFKSILYKKDGDIASQNSDRISVALEENKNWVQGRSTKIIEQDIRQTLSTMNSEQIAAMDKDYREKHNGTGLRDAIMNDPKIHSETKETVDIYLKGADKRTDDDTQKLAQTALEHKDIQMFQEAMTGASPEARKQFLDNGGEKKMKDAFEGHWYNAFKFVDIAGWAEGEYGNLTDQELRHAQDYAKEGKLSAATQVSDNSGLIHWTNNDKGIEKAFNDMSDSDRARYLAGKAISEGKEAPKDMSEDDRKKAIEYYKTTHDTITSTGNASELSKWEDMIAHKGGSLVSKIDGHHGAIYNDSRGDTLKEIENMSQADWEYAKKQYESGHGTEYRAQVQQALETLKGARVSQEDIDKAMVMFDEKMKAGKYEESQKVGRRQLMDALDDDSHWYKNDRKSMVESISNMTKEEQEAYRTNKNGFKDKLDQKLKDAINDGPALDAANRMLSKVMKGESPEADIITKLNVHAQERQEHEALVTTATFAVSPITGVQAGIDSASNDGAMREKIFGTTAGGAMRDLEEALRKDPKLRERITHPQTEADKQFAREFNEAIHRSMSSHDYERYAKPLIETGKLDPQLKMELNQSLVSNDKQQALKDLASLPEEDKKSLLADKDKLERTIGFLSTEDQTVAKKLLEQKDGMHAEDKIKYQLNHWGGSSEIMETLNGLKPGELNQIKAEYQKKYGGNLESDLLDKLGGEDKAKFKQMLIDASSMTAQEKFNAARDEYYKSRDGFGNAFVENIGHTGTGYQLDDAVNQYGKEIAKANAEFREITPQQAAEMQEKFRGALENFKESKSAAADYVVDGTIAVGSMAALIASGGTATPLLIGLAAGGGAMFKVGAKMAIMGNDYDASVSQVSLDALTGSVDGFTSLLGPGEVAAIFKVGEKAAIKATELTVKELGEQGVKTLLKEGSSEVLDKGTQKLMREALANGAKEIDKKAIQELAEKSIKPVSEQFTKEMRDEAVKKLSQSLEKNLTEGLTKETESWLKTRATEGALNAAGGALGGGSSGLITGVAGWDNSKSFEENLKRVAESTAMSAATGGVMAGTFTVAMKGLHAGYEGIKGHARVESPHVHGDTPHVNGEQTHLKGDAPHSSHAPAHSPDESWKDLLVRSSSEIERKIPNLQNDVHIKWYDTPAVRRQKLLDNIRIVDEQGKMTSRIQVTEGGHIINGSTRYYYAKKLGIPDSEIPVTVSENRTIMMSEYRQQLQNSRPHAAIESPGDLHTSAEPHHGETPRSSEVPEREAAAGFREGDAQAWARENKGLREVSPTNKHIDGSTAPNRTLTIDGHPVEVNKPLILGREQGVDIHLTDDGISRQHASIRVDEHGDTYVKDLGSTNGTYVNDKKITAADGEVKLGPNDRLYLASDQSFHEVQFGTEYHPTYRAHVGKTELNLNVGEEVSIGRDKFGINNPSVSRDHAKLGMDQQGLYILEDPARPSANGTFVNGKQLRPGEKVYLKPTDDVTLGHPTVKQNGIPQGDWLQIMPKDVAALPPEPMAGHTIVFNKAIGQSNRYAYWHEVEDKLEDGFQGHYWGSGYSADALGRVGDMHANAIVVDRKNDAVLRSVIEEARTKFGHLPPKEKAEALNNYVNDLLMPKGMSEQALDAWNAAFAREHKGEAILLGEYIKQGKGVCQEQAMLLKVLGDELDLNVKLVKGAGSASEPNSINHVWTEILLPGKKEPLIYDPRWQESGKRYGQIAAHERGLDIDVRLHKVQGPVAENVAPPDLPRAPANVAINGNTLQLDHGYYKLGRDELIARGIPATDLKNVSPHHIELDISEDGRLAITDTSSHGTYVNGQKIKRGEKWPLNPTDDVRLGSPNGPRLELSEKPKPAVDILVNGRKVEIAPGEETPIGRDDFDGGNTKISRQHATLRRTEDGRLYIKDESLNGTWVNGQKLAKGQEYPLGPNDQIRLGTEDGPELKLQEYAKPDALPERTIPDGKIPTRATYQGEEYGVAGFDPDTGDVILKSDKPKYYASLSQPVTPEELATQYRQLQVGDQTLYRDTYGNVYNLNEFDGNKSLWKNHDFQVIPTDKVTIHTPDSVAPSAGPARFKLGNVELPVVPGQEVPIGRNYDSSIGVRVSREHGVIGINEQGPYIRDTGSTYGTWIKREGSQTFERIPTNENVAFKAGDEIRLGGKDGPRLETQQLPQEAPQTPHLVQPERAPDAHLPSPGRPEASPESGVTFVDGMKLYHDANGNRVIEYVEQKGRRTLTHPDGTVVEEFPGGRKSTKHTDGRVVDEFPNGGRVTSKDGQIIERLTPTEIRQRDGSVKQTWLEFGPDNQLRSCTDIHGRRTQFEHAPDGSLRKITFANGNTAETTDGTIWTIHDRTRNSYDNQRGRFEVNKDGHLSWQAEGKNKIVQHPDGSKLTIDKDSGRILQTTRSDGLVTSYSYTTDGHLRQIKRSDNVFMYTLDRKTWHSRNPDGQEFKTNANFHLGKDGTLYNKSHSGDLIKTHLDGSTVIVAKDNSSRLLGPDGRIYEVIAPGDRHTKFDYAPSGEVRKISFPDGRTAQSSDGHIWTIFDATNPEGKQIEGSFKVLPKGDYTWQREGSKNIHTYKADGSKEVHTAPEEPEIPGLQSSRREAAAARPEEEIRPSDIAKDQPSAPPTDLPNTADVQSRLEDLSDNHKFAEQFKTPSSQHLTELRADLERELKAEVPVMGVDGKPTNVFDKFMQSDKLAPEQKERIFNILAEVRDAYKRLEDKIPEGSPAKGYQDVNWKHTRGEIDQVLDSAVKNGLSGEQIEDAIMASTFSDAVKFPKTPQDVGNFLIHNIDGAKAAAEVLPRYFDLSVPGNMKRLEGIYNAIREHQISPPEFMAKITKMSLEGVLGKGITSEQRALVESITAKLAKPLEVEHIIGSDRVARIAFTDEEHALLKKVGIEEWYVPNPDSPWYQVSCAVIDGDSLINYATPDGWAKIAAIRGPETAPWFQDATVFDSLASTKQSFDDAYKVISEKAKPLADAGLERTHKSIERVKGQMEDWFKQLEATGEKIPRNADGKIPFWDAPLKYPKPGEELTPLEKEQFEFAKKIREEMVKRLRAEQGVY